MSDLAEFLLARIAEDEAVARVADVEAEGPTYGPFNRSKLYEQDGVVLFDPARVLAECEAKRRIVAQVSNVEWGGYAVRDVVLALLALPYVDHPDYRQEWRV